jgi:hypothetical protein
VFLRAAETSRATRIPLPRLKESPPSVNDFQLVFQPVINKLTAMNLTQLSSLDLKKITKLLKKKETLLERVAKVDLRLSDIESGGNVITQKVVKKARKKISAAGLARMRAAQKKRWAKVKGKAKHKKHKMSAAGRAAIVAAQKARWAKIKAEKAKKK